MQSIDLRSNRGQFRIRVVDADQSERGIGTEIEIHRILARHETLELQAGPQPPVDEPPLEFERVFLLKCQISLVTKRGPSVGLRFDGDRYLRCQVLWIVHDPDVCHRADSDAAKHDRRTDLQALNRSREIEHPLVLGGQEPPTTEDHDGDNEQNDGTHDKGADHRLIRSSFHDFRSLMNSAGYTES